MRTDPGSVTTPRQEEPHGPRKPSTGRRRFGALPRPLLRSPWTLSAPHGRGRSARHLRQGQKRGATWGRSSAGISGWVLDKGHPGETEKCIPELEKNQRQGEVTDRWEGRRKAGRERRDESKTAPNFLRVLSARCYPDLGHLPCYSLRTVKEEVTGKRESRDFLPRSGSRGPPFQRALATGIHDGKVGQNLYRNHFYKLDNN